MNTCGKLTLTKDVTVDKKSLTNTIAQLCVLRIDLEALKNEIIAYLHPQIP